MIEALPGTIEIQKQAAAHAAVDTLVRNGMRVGLGTGSTAYWAIKRVAERIANGWKLTAVPTSIETEHLCMANDIPVSSLAGPGSIDVTIDGADEVAADLDLIKGGGGAMFRERAVALASEIFAIVVIKEKLVERLGAFPLPVEVVPFSVDYVKQKLAEICPRVTIRERGSRHFLTDNGNFILDCHFGRIDEPAECDAQIRSMHGVVTTGIFHGLTTRVFVADLGGVRVLTP